MKIAIGCDEAAFSMKEKVKEHLLSKGYEVKDFGVYDENPVLYPDIAMKVAVPVSKGDFDRGILICGTGIGMAMTANKVKGIRAAVCHDPFSTERSILSNNAQIMCMGARVIAPQLALMLVDQWLSLEFKECNSSQKIAKICEYEEGNFQ